MSNKRKAIRVTILKNIFDWIDVDKNIAERKATATRYFFGICTKHDEEVTLHTGKGLDKLINNNVTGFKK